MEHRTVPAQKCWNPSASHAAADGVYLHVLPSVVKPVHPEQSVWQVLAWADAPGGQNRFSTPPSPAHEISLGATHCPAEAGAAVLPEQSVQSVEQRLVTAQKFLKSLVQLDALAVHVAPSLV